MVGHDKCDLPSSEGIVPLNVYCERYAMGLSMRLVFIVVSFILYCSLIAHSYVSFFNTLVPLAPK